jgi:hypothetical protein
MRGMYKKIRTKYVTTTEKLLTINIRVDGVSVPFIITDNSHKGMPKIMKNKECKDITRIKSGS